MIHPLDIITTILGLAYIILEYRASIWLWAVGFVMQAMGIVLYYDKGLYADCGMEFYYLSMTIYGFIAWRWGSKRGKGREERGEGSVMSVACGEAKDESDVDSPLSKRSSSLPITHFPRRWVLPWVGIILAVWAAIWFILITWTDSRVPVADSFTTALSIVGIWALARKYVEQWLIWIAVDVVTSVLYFYKDIPFKASLYALYTIIAVFGYLRWRRMAVKE